MARPSLIIPNKANGIRFAAVGAYMAMVLAANLIWETLQLPLYTLWRTAPPSAIAYAVVHCTVGDVLIATLTLVASLVLTRSWHWPRGQSLGLALLVIAFGAGYTIFSEWLNVEVRRTWAYSSLMPTIPVGSFNLGLSPLLQWLTIPAAALWAIHRTWDRDPRRQ